MGIINGENLKAISKAFKKEFQDSYSKVEINYPKVATEVKSNTISTDYTWLGDFPKMIEWIGDRAVKDLKAHSYNITKKRFELTIGMDRDYIIYDNLGLMKPRIQQMAWDAKTHYDEIVFPLLETNGKCYDKKRFFATNHKVGTIDISNLGNLPLNKANFLKTRASMMSLKGENGKKLGIKPNLIIVPPLLEETALELFQTDKINGSSNITKGMVEILVIADLTDDKAWYLLDTTRPLKPLVLQINKPIDFTAMDKADDEAVFTRAEFRYGLDSEDNAGYGLWQLAYKQTGTGQALPEDEDLEDEDLEDEETKTNEENNG